MKCAEVLDQLEGRQQQAKKTGVALCLNNVLLLKEPEICESTLLSVKVPIILKLCGHGSTR